MEININWTFTALEDLANIHEYKAAYSKKSANKYTDALFKYTERLKQHPEICALCRNPTLAKRKYRCCTFKDHIIIYKYVGNVVSILSIIHARKNPKDFAKVKG